MERQRQGRQESPVTVLDSEEEREKFYALQREKRRKRKHEKGMNMSGSESGSASAGISAGGIRRGAASGTGDGDDSIRIIGVKRGRKSSELIFERTAKDDEEFQVIDSVVPTGAMLRLDPTSSSAITIGKNDKEENSDSRMVDDRDTDTDADADAPSALRAGLARFKYSSYSSHNASSSSSTMKTTTTTAKTAMTTTMRVIPTSRAAVAKLQARSFTTTTPNSAASGRSRERSETASVRSRTESLGEGSANAAVEESATSATTKKRTNTAKKKMKAAVPDMPVAPEQIKELDGCVVCGTRFDRRKTAKTRWAHMVDCFPPGHKPDDERPDLTLLVSEALDKLSRNTFHPALATQTTLLQSVALKQQHQPKLPPLIRPAAPIILGEAPSVVDMHFDQTKSGRARLNARKRALATRKGGSAAEVRVVGVDAESRGGVGFSEEIRNMLDEEYAEERERSVERSAAGSDVALDGHGVGGRMDVDSESEGEIPFPPTQTFGQSSLQARMTRGGNGGSRGIFAAEAGVRSAPFEAGKSIDNLMDLLPESKQSRQAASPRRRASSAKGKEKEIKGKGRTAEQEAIMISSGTKGTGTQDSGLGLPLASQGSASGSEEVMFVREQNGDNQARLGNRRSGPQQAGSESPFDRPLRDEPMEAEHSTFQDLLPYTSSPPPPPAPPMKFSARGMVTPTPKRKIEEDEASPSADSPALSRLAKRMARSSMSSPKLPDLSQLRDEFGDGAAFADAFDEERWEEERWGDDAVMAWEREFSSARRPSGLAHDHQAVNRQQQAFGNGDTAGKMDSSESDVPLSKSIGVRRAKKKSVISVTSDEEATMSDVPGIAAVSLQQHRQNLLDRGMPDYASWDLPDLQSAVSVFGLKPSKIAKTMIEQLQLCWEAIHPEKPVKGKGKARATKAAPKATVARGREKKAGVADEAEVSGEDILGNESASLAEPKKRAPKKPAAKKPEKAPPLTVEQLNAEFEKLILEPHLYIRVLRYEPLYFETLANLGTERGITGSGWKNVFKKYLDDQSITYYVEEPTGKRRRR
ncbi:hypothetical protein QFC22_000050 [Naganishia vaughanmartiniae]|uniref:Uncharacterized protein n=1 Tax=Naganishia vaughanmartiniae TaxID=1424756 RepID=A0ACC2XPC0_9TREE|nr:hypothetical protein QFC22_000050 [Naganishia vaughanmartiniae]